MKPRPTLRRGALEALLWLWVCGLFLAYLWQFRAVFGLVLARAGLA